MDDDEEGKVAGFYGLSGNTNLWTITWGAPPGSELIAPPGDGFILEVRRKSNNAVLLSYEFRGSERGHGIASISEIRAR